MPQPLVSVIIPTYNCGSYVAETIDSVLWQTHPRREVIIVDDGSTDDTPRVVERYGSAVTYIRQANAGVGAARNAGLGAASGDYVAFLDSDDVWLPEKLEIQLAVAARHPDSGLVVCDGVQFDGDTIMNTRLLHGPTADRLDAAPDATITVEHFYREVLEYNGVICCPAQTLIPRHVIARVGPQATARPGLPDHDYHLRIAREYPVTLHRHALVRWRYLASSLSGPADRRHLVWAVRTVAVLKQEIRRCSPEDRAFVRAQLRATVRKTAGDAWDYGRRHDFAYARSHLVQLARLLPRDPSVALAILALYVPAALVERGLRVRRALRAACRIAD